MKKLNYNSSKNKKYSKSKSLNKIPNSRKSKINIGSNFKLKPNNLKFIEMIQKNWRIFFNKSIEKKIIKIQSVYRGYNIRNIFNDIVILNKKLECFFFIIKITMFRHGIKYDYLSNKRIDYYTDHKRTKQFLLLQRRIKYFLFMKKIKILDQLGIFEKIYIITSEFRTKIKSKKSADRYFSIPIKKYHIPLTQIIMIQNNYRLHLKYIKKLPRYNINKISLNKCPLIIKLRKIIKADNDEIYKNVKMRPINNKKDFYIKKNYNYTPLLLIQKKYKQKFNFLKENFKLKKHAKIKRTIINKHHYIYHATVIDATDKVLLIQKNIKYFLYRKHSIINLIPKRRIEKCVIEKSYGYREYINKFFYEDFASRLIIIIRKFFLSLYLNEIMKNYKKKPPLPIQSNKINIISKLFLDPKIKTLKKEENLNPIENNNINIINKKSLKRKETFNISSPKKIKPSPSSTNKPRHSSLLNSNDSNQTREKEKKKKVSFKNDIKTFKRDIKNIISKVGHGEVDSSSKNANSIRKSETQIIRRKERKKK